MSMDTSTSGGQGDGEDIKVKNVSEIINCSLDLARELLTNCDGDVNKVIDNFCGAETGSQSVQKKNEADSRQESLSAFYEYVEEGRDREHHRVKCLLCSDGRLVSLISFSQHVKEVHDFQDPSTSCSKKKEEDMESAANLPAQEFTMSSGGISSMLKRKKPPVESIITIDDSDDNENPGDEVLNDEVPNENKKFKKLRDDLSHYLVNVRKAGYMSQWQEEDDRMTLEDCPKCSAPQILLDNRVSLYHCPQCGADTCRKCLMQAHGERKCKEGKEHEEVKEVEEDQEVKEVEVDYKKMTVLPSRNFDMDNEMDREFRIAEGQFLRMAGAKRKCYEIKSVDVVYNKKLKEKFEDKKQELQRRGLDDKPLLIFHGTPQENIEPILRDNFDLTKVVNGRKFGNGVYFSEMPEVSLGYSRDQSSLILCLVLQGDNTKEMFNPTGVQAADSQVPKNGAWAIIVPDVDQILPKYVINFVDIPKDKRTKVMQPLGLHYNLGSIHYSNPSTQINLGAGPSGSAQQQANVVSRFYSQHLQGGVQQYLGPPAVGTVPLPGQAGGGIVQGAAQNLQPVSVSYSFAPNIIGYCHICKLEFSREDTMRSHMQGAKHLRKELALMRNPMQPVNQGQVWSTSTSSQPLWTPSSQPVPANQAVTSAPTPNQQVQNWPWVTPAPGLPTPAAVTTLAEQLLQIVSQGTTGQQIPAPQVLPPPPPSRSGEILRTLMQKKAEKNEADADRGAASSSHPTFKNQEPKPPRVKLVVVDSSGTAVPGTRVDLANCRGLYCALCDVWMTSKEMIWEHKKGEEHIMMMMEANKKDEQHEKKEDAE